MANIVPNIKEHNTLVLSNIGNVVKSVVMNIAGNDIST